jgi:hypothetical protein
MTEKEFDGRLSVSRVERDGTKLALTCCISFGIDSPHTPNEPVGDNQVKSNLFNGKLSVIPLVKLMAIYGDHVCFLPILY